MTDFKPCYNATLKQRIACFFGNHDWKEYGFRKDDYFCLRIECSKFKLKGRK